MFRGGLIIGVWGVILKLFRVLGYFLEIVSYGFRLRIDVIVRFINW